ncbi:hypothetical protein GCM10007199_19450 [Fictibacillus barbaricus]|nr:hypothetical protein GCM10007199_19450 [Fictibacillus barbaricus]
MKVDKQPSYPKLFHTFLVFRLLMKLYLLVHNVSILSPYPRINLLIGKCPLARFIVLPQKNDFSMNVGSSTLIDKMVNFGN